MKPPLRSDDTQQEDGDPSLYRRLVRDICYLYHELAEYRHIMWDLDYQADYPLEYWNLINRIDTGSCDDRFVRAGILIHLLAMIKDEIEGSGARIYAHHDEVRKAIFEFVPEDTEMLRLSNAVMAGLNLFRDFSSDTEQLDADAAWAYAEFVEKYFTERGKRQ